MAPLKPDPTLTAILNELAATRSALKNVRMIHVRGTHRSKFKCRECGFPWPCATFTAAGGRVPPEK